MIVIALDDKAIQVEFNSWKYRALSKHSVGYQIQFY